MSHLHLPDGILPLWLVLSGWGGTLVGLAIALTISRRFDLHRRLPRLGFLSALMIVAMSVEILPLAYHLDLSVLTGIVLGPAVGFLAAFVVDLLLALVGHGGITVVGLNAPILGAEIALGSLLFAALRRLGLPDPLSAGISTVLVLAFSTSLMVGVVGLSGLDPTRLHERQPAQFRAFMLLVYGLGSLGWILEAALTASIVRYLSRVRPGLLAGG